MKWYILLILLSLTFIIGLAAGSMFFPTTIYKTQTPREAPQYIQTLSKEGFVLEIKSAEQKVWITTESFGYFVDLASYYGIETVYYDFSIYGKYYFWFPLPFKPDQILRWDIP